MADGTVFLDLDADVVELAPYVPPPPAGAPLREVAFRANAWLPAELDRLRELFAADVPVQDIADDIGRPLNGVRDKLFTLGLRRNCSRPWSELEDAELVRRYGADTAAAIALDLGRSPSAVYVRAALHGLTEEQPPAWDAWEDEQLRAGYAAGLPVPQIAVLIGRSRGACNTRAHNLGLRNASTPADWSESEAARALELAYEGHRYLAIIEQLVAEGFPRRTKNGFGQRLRILGYGRGWGRAWTEDERELLRRAYRDGGSLTRLCETLGRRKPGVMHQAKALGLHGTHEKKAGWRTEPAWTEEEEALLKAQYGTVKPRLIAKQLGRSVGGVYQRANVVLGLNSGRYSAVTPDEDRAIGIAWRRGLGTVDVGVAIGRDPSIVSVRARILGIPFSSPDRPVKPKPGRPTGAPPREYRLTLADILAMDDGAPAPVPRFTKKGRPLAADPADRHHRSRPKVATTAPATAPADLPAPPPIAPATETKPPRRWPREAKHLPWRKRWRCAA